MYVVVLDEVVGGKALANIVGEQPVHHGVARRAALAFLCFRSGTQLSVGAVCRDLCCCTHRFCGASFRPGAEMEFHDARVGRGRAGRRREAELSGLGERRYKGGPNGEWPNLCVENNLGRGTAHAP